jgi:hypothetical protein
MYCVLYADGDGRVFSAGPFNDGFEISKWATKYFDIRGGVELVRVDQLPRIHEGYWETPYEGMGDPTKVPIFIMRDVSDDDIVNNQRL